MIAVKKQNSNLKLLFSIGDWNIKPNGFNSLLNDTDSKALFIKNILEFLIFFKFDGLDLTFPGLDQSNKSLLTSFIKVYFTNIHYYVFLI